MKTYILPLDRVEDFRKAILSSDIPEYRQRIMIDMSFGLEELELEDAKKMLKLGDTILVKYTDKFVPEFVFESKFQKADFKISDKLYHVAPISLKDRILRGGLAPKSKSKMHGFEVAHPERVYLFNSLNINLLKSFCRAARKKSIGYSSELKTQTETFEYAVFEIDPKRVPGLKLFRDNNFENIDDSNPTAVYSYTNIPPAAIKFIQSIDTKIG